MKIRAYFLIIAALALSRVPAWEAAVVFVGYLICEQIDRFLTRRAKDQVTSQELLWEQDPDDSTKELHGGLSRVRLPREHQIVVTRIAEILRRIE